MSFLLHAFIVEEKQRANPDASAEHLFPRKRLNLQLHEDRFHPLSHLIELSRMRTINSADLGL